jgi:hypothetical protein
VSTPARVAAFVLGLVAVFGAALGVGAAVGPVGAAAAPMADGGHGDDGGDHEASASPAALPAGLQVSDGGYSLELAAASLPAGPAVPLSFRITGPDGAAVTAYDESHEQDLHLIAVRRDLSGFQHVHPTLGPDGTWTTPLALAPGSWRVLADFVPTADGEKHVLGADLAVPGELAPVQLPPPAPTAEVDGYTVTLDGSLPAGEESALTFSVSRDGAPVTDLQPYLGAAGHLVVLRAGDLAYLHVHPEDGELSFATTAPTAGTYRLFLDFRHGDVVRTAAFTVEADRG